MAYHHTASKQLKISFNAIRQISSAHSNVRYVHCIQ